MYIHAILFQDTTIRKTKDGSEMKQWLHGMTAHGGGDCPEMAMAGIVNGSFTSHLRIVIYQT